jgi:hypothetical protein
MPDAPKCPSCLDKGYIYQAFRLFPVNGEPMFKCACCGSLFARTEFEDIELSWKDDPKAWNKSHKRPSNKSIIDGDKV